MLKGRMVYSYQKFLEQAMADRGPDHHIWEINDKMEGRELGYLAGLHVPEIYQGPKSIRGMESPDHNVVIKPLNGCSSRGIRPLKYLGSEASLGGYYDLFLDEVISWDQAVAYALADKHTPRNLSLIERNHPDALRPPWLLEELILSDTGNLPDNWKAFCFGAEVVAIFHSRRQLDGSLRIRWWNRDFEDIGDICPSKKWKYDRRMAKPKNPEGLIKGFEDVASLVDSPFIRVDLYERGTQIVYGEVTPHPTGGTSPFIPEWDERFGQAWHDAL